MFAELIRRKFGAERLGSSEAAFESTTVSLSTAVPRPAERRNDERLSAMLRVGKTVVVVVESLRPVKGEVRWYSDRRAGIVFERPLEFEELTEWVGKRLELASLKASYKVG